MRTHSSERVTLLLAAVTGLAFSAFLAALTLVARMNAPSSQMLLAVGLLGPVLLVVVAVAGGLPPSRPALLASCIPPIISAFTCAFVLFFTGPGGITVSGEPGRFFALGFCALYLWLFLSALRLIPTRQIATDSRDAV